MKTITMQDVDINNNVRTVLLEITNRYYKTCHIECYTISREERIILNDFETKFNLLYIQLGKLLEDNGLKKMGIYCTYDLYMYYNAFIQNIYNIYNDLKKIYSDYYHVSIDYLNVNMDTDINNFYILLGKKKKQYYFEILNKEILKYKANKWYVYLEDDFKKLIDEYISNYSIIDDNVINKFNNFIVGFLNYYDRNYKEDIKDIEKLKFLSDEDIKYLESFAGLWSYFQKRDNLLQKKPFYVFLKRLRGLLLLKQFGKINTEANKNELFYNNNQHRCVITRSIK